MICKECNKDIIRIKSKKYGKSYFLDLDNRIWAGRTCPTCHCKKVVQYGRKDHKPVDEVTEACNKKGRESEKLAAKDMELMGFDVILGTGKGPDIIASMGPITIVVEVKTAHKIRSKTTHRVCPVSPKRKQDDILAAVFPDGSVKYYEMSEHLKKCQKEGHCHVR